MFLSTLPLLILILIGKLDMREKKNRSKHWRKYQDCMGSRQFDVNKR